MLAAEIRDGLRLTASGRAILPSRIGLRWLGVGVKACAPPGAVSSFRNPSSAVKVFRAAPRRRPNLSARRCFASWCKNRPTSVTSPIVCDDPRSASFVTTAGLMSTHTTGTQAGSMLPTPIPCSIDDSTIPGPPPRAPPRTGPARRRCRSRYRQSDRRRGCCRQGRSGRPRERTRPSRRSSARPTRPRRRSRRPR